MESAHVLGWVFMTISGIFLATQSGINLTLGRHVGKSFAAVVSFFTGLCALCIFFAIDVGAAKSAGPTKAGVQGAPWWAWIGGPLGGFYVASNIVFAPKLGAGNAISVFVAAQLVTALVLDSCGWLGYAKRKFHWARALGVALLVVGVVLIARFDGGTGSSSSAVPSPQPSEAQVNGEGHEGGSGRRALTAPVAEKGLQGLDGDASVTETSVSSHSGSGKTLKVGHVALQLPAMAEDAPSAQDASHSAAGSASSRSSRHAVSRAAA